MRIRVSRLAAATFITVALVVMLPSQASAQAVRDRYEALLEREQTARARIAETAPDAPATVRDAALRQARNVVAGYDALARRYRSSGYADNALWNAATMSDLLFARFNGSLDRDAAARYRQRLIAEYPSSSLVKAAKAAELAATAAPAAATESMELPPAAPQSITTSAISTPSAATARPRASTGKAVLTSIEREILPEAVRITLLLDREVVYREQRLAGPERVFFDLKNVSVAPELRDVVLRYENEGVRQIRVGRHPDSTVRVVLDLEGIKKYSVFTLYNPFRVVVDCEPALTHTNTAAGFGAAGLTSSRTNTAAGSSVAVPTSTRTNTSAGAGESSPPSARTPAPSAEEASVPVRAASVPPSAPVSVVSRPVAPAAPPAAVQVAAPAVEAEGPSPSAAGSAPPPPPAAPTSNTAGGFSLSRQLGLGVTRIVIDPGHGGHDPGAQARGLNEADLTLDIALRLEKLLQQEGLEVVLTRRTDAYIPLEERTAIANRESADLFLSIHANASRNESARGVETYFLSFASSPEAEAVAARENSASAGGMHNLPDIIKAIALNNKLDESRDFAGMVQEALVSRLRRSNKDLRNLGVKKAPFVVLIGAGMPSVLAEISFLTNKQELQLLKTSAYKQRVAEALHTSIMRYRRSLKGQGRVAEQ